MLSELSNPANPLEPILAYLLSPNMLGWSTVSKANPPGLARICSDIKWSIIKCNSASIVIWNDCESIFPSESITLAVMVWVPTLRDKVWNKFPFPIIPSILDVHVILEAMSPSSESNAVPENVILSVSLKVIPKIFGKGRKVHPSRKTHVKRNWRRSRIKA